MGNDRKVSKYEVNEDGTTQIDLPAGFEVIDFRWRDDRIWMWVIVDPDALTTERYRFKVLRTESKWANNTWERIITTHRHDKFGMRSYHLIKKRTAQ